MTEHSHAELYDRSRRRIVALVTAPGVDLSVPVPATPGWTAHDLLAHLAGELGDFLTRRFDVEEGDDFGERTVRERAGRSVDELLAEWERHRAASEEMLAGPVGAVLVSEIIAHEHDLRGALRQPGGRDDPGVRAALARPLQEIDLRLRADGAPPVEVVVDGDPVVLGGDGDTNAEGSDPTTTLRVSAFELLRALGGRRSVDQLRGLDWTGPPRLEIFALFGTPRATDLVE